MPRQLDLWEDSSLEQTVSTTQEPAVDGSFALAASESSSKLFRLLVNPERQILYDGLPPIDWPDPSTIHNDGSLTIDRLKTDIDGPPHRFVVQLSDYVEVYENDTTVIYGEVTGLSQERQEVRVRKQLCDEGCWYSIEQVFPATQPRRHKRAKIRTVSHVAEDKIILREGGSKLLDLDEIAKGLKFTPIKTVTLSRIGSILDRPKIQSTEDAIEFFKTYWEQFPGSDQERFVVGCLDTKHRVQSVIEISVGTLDASLVHPREVFRPAVIEASAAVILSHNHPSGDPTPSREDIAVTTRLTDSGQLLGINVLDHIVYGCGTGKALSIREYS